MPFGGGKALRHLNETYMPVKGMGNIFIKTSNESS